MTISNPITHAPRLSGTTDPRVVKLCDDPWSLAFAERASLAVGHADEQARWLPVIQGLVEPPAIDDSFPAFLLATPPFAHLAEAIAGARQALDLNTGAADELQRFVDRYRGYLLPPEV